MTASESSTWKLQNQYLTAEFNSGTGQLTGLRVAGNPENLLEKVYLTHQEAPWDQPRIYGDHDLYSKPYIQYKVESLAFSDDAVTCIAVGGAVRIEYTYRLRADFPLLEARYRISSPDPATEIRWPALPGLLLGQGFNPVFEDEEDLSFDGEEIGDGTELPCWRVFFREGHRDGLMLATRSKLQMSHVLIRERGFEVKPHIMPNYDISLSLPRQPMTFADCREYPVEFEVGPWRKTDHGRILNAGSMQVPVPAGSGPLVLENPMKTVGIVLDASVLGESVSASSRPAADAWRQVENPGFLAGKALVAPPACHPPEIRIDPGLTGNYQVYVGIASGDGVAVRLGSDQYRTIRPTEGTPGAVSTPFHLRLSGWHEKREVYFRMAKMDGETLLLGKLPCSYATTIIDYVRFEPVGENGPPDRSKVPLIGLADIPDIAFYDDVRNPDPDIYRMVVREHARCGFTRIDWRIDGQCSDFPCKVNTMRYPSAKVHGLFHPQARAYGRVLRQVDMLRLAIETAHAHHLLIYGWMRFNSYSGNVACDFFRNHPQYHERWPDGSPAAKLCLAFPEVRKHKIDILLEALSYGLDGINLGFLRMPPVLLAAPILVDGYREKYGIEPPLQAEAAAPLFWNSLPPNSEESVCWHRYRASFLTTFGRELRQAMANHGFADRKITVWVRPNHCLYDGIDLPVWLEENLCDEVMVQENFTDAEDSFYRPRPEWVTMVRDSVPLVHVTFWKNVGQFIADKSAQRADGICIYESNDAVIRHSMLRILADAGYGECGFLSG